MTRLGLIVVLTVAALCGVPVSAAACVPPADYIENFQAYEDEQLNEVTVLFRGVIENLNFEGEAVTMDIRHTRTFWGRGAPRRIRIERDYYHMCAQGNLHFAVQETEYPITPPPGAPRPDMPVVRNGLGVTVLGRAEDANTPWELTILVDHTGDTQRVLRRFQELKQAQ